ncbi:major facilitator family transporter [Caballeronia sordidicola]|uniref:Major facilitator family transporter n=1 Tax=Caballeronia sordidicola TaxID=196367 RepID=A0A158FWU4_CABSO|nr:MFS transporter [Caballeronia sordidicola]SAL23630.1 major facilitator family transporter [Caballeronia sordidicola]
MLPSAETPAPAITAREPEHTQGLTLPLTIFFATAVGVMVMNLFAAQTLTGAIGRSLRLAPEFAGLAAMLPQLGYAIGLVLLVPLCDLLENRRLIVCTLAMGAVFLAIAMVAEARAVFLVAVLLAGVASSAIQMLVPMAASMAPESHRGRAVGNVMSGLMLGILLSRPAASLIAGTIGWRAFYGLAALTDAWVALVLYLKLPVRTPANPASYPALLYSLWTLMRTEPVLQRNAVSAALVMGAFSAFWTAIGLRLVQPPFGFGMNGIALFALAGAAGAIVTPLAGRAGDRGWSRTMLFAGHLTMLAALVAIGVAGAGWGGFAAQAHPPLAIAMLVAGAAALDAGVVTDQTLGRRAINLMDPAARGRLNGLFVGTFFVGGAVGAACSGAAWALAGWSGVCAVGFVFTLCAFVLRLTGRRGDLSSPTVAR